MFLSEENEIEDGLDDSLHIVNWINTIWNITIKPPFGSIFGTFSIRIEFRRKSKFVVP